MNQLACWDFRANEDYFTSDQLLCLLPKLGKKFAFQLEKGASTGYVHWQGRISLHKKRRKDEVQTLWEAEIGKFPNYFEGTVTKEHHKGDMFYQLKTETRLEGPWTDKVKPSYIRKRLRNVTLKPWQSTILASSTTSGMEDRTINIIYDVEGNKGKSFLVDYCDDHDKGIEIPSIVNDGKEILQAVTNILLSTDNREPGIMFLDLARAMPKDRLNGIMTALETIKRGKVYDFRYNFKVWKFESPAIWVFTNIMPNLEWMSADRWRFHRIQKDELVKLRGLNA